MAWWTRKSTGRGVCGWRRSTLCVLTLTLSSCGLYVSSRELAASDGGADDADSTTSADAAVGCTHPEGPRCDYRFKRELTFNATPLGEELLDFPVLVTLDETRIDYAQTQAGGADLRFLDDDGTLLAHEIERWQPNGVSSIWVRIPRFDPRTRKTITYFYGSSTAKALTKGVDVFTADYEAVYHLSDSLARDRIIHDALEQHDGRPSSALNASASVEGRIGGGLALGTGGQFVELPGLESTGLTALTVELWVREGMPRQSERLICRDSATSALEPIACLGLELGNIELALTTSGSGGRFGSDVVDEEGLEPGWNHLAMVWDASDRSVRVLRNGSQLSAYSQTGQVLAASILPWVLGDRGPGSGFSGELDEVRIAHVARSNTWLLATTVIAGDLLKEYGPEQPL